MPGTATFGASVSMWEMESSFYEDTEQSVNVDFFIDQVWNSTGRLDVSFRRWDLSACEAADLLHQLWEVSVGGKHQPNEEAGLYSDTEENDHHQVRSEHGFVMGKRNGKWNWFCVSSEGRCTRAFQTSPSWRGTGLGSWWSLRERSTRNSPLTSATKQP